VFGNNGYAFYHHLCFFYQYFQHGAGLFKVFVIACDNNYLVALADVVLWFESCFHFVYLIPAFAGVFVYVPDTARNRFID
jgi:hypothetical protein